jgi:hypothetical protein
MLNNKQVRQSFVYLKTLYKVSGVFLLFFIHTKDASKNTSTCAYPN